ncbi:S1 family peptidase [Streptomyces sp. NPDC050738]|uniref:S1 family peptidase n=1 Tax=Streptomyces sp. NPDC050738 TaxID=3154744 RepID=UPI0034300D87
MHPTHATAKRRRATLGAGVCALLIATAASVGLPSASAADSGSDRSPAVAAEPASSGLLTAMQKDLGLTKAEAVKRLAAEKQATAVEGRARNAAGATFGGAWFDAAAGKLTVAITDKSKAAAVRASGADVRLVPHTQRLLDGAKKKIDALKAPAGVSSWHVDPQASRVIVNIVSSRKGDNDVRAFVAQAAKAGPVTIQQVSEAPRTYAAGTVGGDPYYTGNVRCSIGFSVYGGFVSAGHCGQPSAEVRGWDGSLIGNFQGSSFPGNDYSWVSVGNGWWTVPVVLGWGTVSDQLVRGSAVAPIGASICRSGSTSHWHCGNVLATNETVNYSQGAVYEMTKTSVCAEPGDSGGSFISGDQAQGVTSGGWGNCSSGGETWHQPINEILNRYGLTLHTA